MVGLSKTGRNYIHEKPNWIVNGVDNNWERNWMGYEYDNVYSLPLLPKQYLLYIDSVLVQDSQIEACNQYTSYPYEGNIIRSASFVHHDL